MTCRPFEIQGIKKPLKDVVFLWMQSPECIALTSHATKEEMWQLQMTQFFQCAHGVLKFAKKIPGRETLSG